MTLFDECEEALSEDFHLLSEDEKEQVLKEFYKYPFEYGCIDKDSKKIKILNPDRLIELIEKKIINQNVYVLADINDVPIFKTNLLLALDKLDDISALSTRVFILGIGYLAQIVSRNPPLDIVIPINGDISKFL
ncbi:hypothetical protein [Haemophilus seminalis]|uniref:Uncharacterized protein n=1 Tax=Haemophilus seminalis TaxID=2582921 RepID=A0ABQ6SMQ4_9PAST|nr:hypothetical protein [Haemophilus seminalis]KAA5523733.1 hypothetical protein F2S80_03130 [Haemophilus seminalis]